MTSSSIVAWSMVSYGYAVKIVTMNSWWPSTANVGGSALLVDAIFPEAPIRQWVLRFPFQLRFLLARHPTLMGKVLSIVYRTLSTHLIKQAGYTRATAHTGSVTLIQRFGSALNLNLQFHLLFLDGVYAEDADGKQRFHRVKAPSHCDLNTLRVWPPKPLSAIS